MAGPRCVDSDAPILFLRINLFNSTFVKRWKLWTKLNKYAETSTNAKPVQSIDEWRNRLNSANIDTSGRGIQLNVNLTSDIALFIV